MPIRPEMRPLYPKDWPFIVVEVKEREGGCCKFCKVPDRTTVWRLKGTTTWRPASLTHNEESQYNDDWRPVHIILTTAHLDHDPTNNGVPGDRPNLASLCQYCHNLWDAKHRADGRERRKLVAAGQLSLLPQGEANAEEAEGRPEPEVLRSASRGVPGGA